MNHDYDRRFCRLSDRVEKGLLVLIACAALLLVTGQALCQYEPIRHLLIETERWEGNASLP